MAMQSRRDEDSLDELSSPEENIKKLLTQPASVSSAAKTSQPAKDLPEVLSLMKQLSHQYDELAAYLKSLSTRSDESTDNLPVDLLSSFVQSSRISPSLVKIISTVADENKSLRAEADELRKREEKLAAKLQDISSNTKTKKHELKYLQQTTEDLTNELRQQREEAATIRRRLLETEAALASQKKITKQLLETSAEQTAAETHEAEKALLKRLAEEKAAEADDASRRAEEAQYALQSLRRDLEIAKIQNTRLKTRADLRESALSACNQEMERLMKQLERLARTETQHKERLAHANILQKRREIQKPRPDFDLSPTPDPESFGLESESSTATSFQEMQKKTEEMTKKFQELEELLEDIKKGNDSDMHKVGDRVRRASELRK
ncbi:hypothetical protein NEHOM01_1031 [Nematocida homosporus]|uniref:uncharacterized protein n=1 Tax=Nematocida homosporus TaxID=1912981 RepID=UPI00221FA703|nr:uncharacterized protein NEHOM01_1031 [Nematocida homosporus]KAI5185739.1 hypothetical protein NEHOM01_1031 [Nematocida homosporus]